jgi:cyclase
MPRTLVPVSRREFVLSAAAFAGAAAFPAFLRAQEKAPPRPAEFYDWKEVRPGFHVALGRTGDDMTLVGGNATLVVEKGRGRGGRAVLIDTKQAVLGPALVREAMFRCEGLHRVVNTHHHFDHAGGNSAASQGGVVMWAHPKCRERISASIAQYTAQLDQKISALEQAGVEGAREAAVEAKRFRDTLAERKPETFIPEAIPENVKDFAGRRVEVHHAGPGHTDNDLFFFFPEDNVLVTGDLVFNGSHPYYDSTAGADSKGWINALSRVVSLCDADTVVVPGHGPITNIDGVKKQIRYIEDVREAVGKAVKEGRSREEVEKLRLPAYAEYGLKPAAGLIMAGVWDELNGKKDAK